MTFFLRLPPCFWCRKWTVRNMITEAVARFERWAQRLRVSMLISSRFVVAPMWRPPEIILSNGRANCMRADLPG
jgi:hypothetical protein